MFLTKQFMDRAVDQNYPLDEAKNRLVEATYQQLIDCKHRIMDDAWVGKYNTDEQRQHIYDLNVVISEAIAERNDIVDAYNKRSDENA